MPGGDATAPQSPPEPGPPVPAEDGRPPLVLIADYLPALAYEGEPLAIGFNAKYLIWVLLGAPKDVQERLKPHFMAGFP